MTEQMSKVVGDENRGETGILNACLESARFLLPIKALVIRVAVLILSLTWRDLAVWFSFPKDRAGFLLVEGSCPTLSVPLFLLRCGPVGWLCPRPDMALGDLGLHNKCSESSHLHP